MKLNKTFNYICLASMLAGAVSACDKDGEMITTGGAPSTEIESSGSDIILSIEHLNDLALTLYWDENGQITLSDPRVEAPSDVVTNTVQFDTEETFATPYDFVVEQGKYYVQMTHQQLNTACSRLGLEPLVPAKVYVRLKSAVGVNIPAKYSNVMEYTITPYFIDWSVAKILDKDHNETGRILASPAENRIYSGFVGAAAWENWFLLESDYTEWGNLGQDGKSFFASSEADKWNFWYPAPAGCYYTTVNTIEGWWSAQWIEKLEITGDVTGEMTFNRAANQWSLAVNSPAARSVSITIAGTCQLYDSETTADGPAKAGTAGFAGTADALTFGSTASAVTIDLPAGDTNIVLDLSDPKAWTIGTGEAAEVPSVSPLLYFSGLVNWDGFDDTLTLTDADALTYGGAHYIDSEWGYRVYPEADWSAAYKAAEGATGLAGTLVKAEGDNDGNVPGPGEAGLFVMNFNMKDLSYTLTKVNSVSFTGANDEWSLMPLTQSAENPEIWTLEFAKTANTPWGTKLIINEDWNLFFGGGQQDGILYLRTDSGASGFEGDNAIEIGKTAVLTVDFGKQTYTFTSK